MESTIHQSTAGNINGCSVSFNAGTPPCLNQYSHVWNMALMRSVFSSRTSPYETPQQVMHVLFLRVYEENNE